MHGSETKPWVSVHESDGVITKQTVYPSGRVTRIDETDLVVRVRRGRLVGERLIAWDQDITIDSPAPRFERRTSLLPGPARAGFGSSSIVDDVEAA